MHDLSKVYHAGNTVRLQCIFEDFDGIRVDPDVVKISFYDSKYNKLDEVILGTSNQTDVGVYFYHFVTDNEEEKRYVYEWYGELNGLPSLKRSSFRTVFI